MKFVLGLLLLPGLWACSKDENNNQSTPDNISVITINTPVAGFTYLNGGTMRMEGEINDGDKVATARVQVRNKITNALYFEQSSAAGNITRYFFLWDWNITGITSPVTATVVVTSKDARGYEISKTVDVNINP
jgi:hypothetical protein